VAFWNLLWDAEDGGGRGALIEFERKLPQPCGFLGDVGSGGTFHLGTREVDAGLEAPAHSDACHVARRRLAVVNVAGPV
jgi:hypothetical protein